MSTRPWMARAWTLVILALCWCPKAYMPSEDRGPKPFFISYFDKAVHFGIFGVFAVLWVRSGPTSGRAARVLLAGLALAALSELGQESRLVNRDASWMDGVADGLGVVAGLLASRAFDRARAGKPPA